MILIKIGGGARISIPAIAADIAALRTEPVGSDGILLVHGANAIRDRIAVERGKPTRTLTSPSGVTSVHTDADALETFLMAYPGVANSRIVAVLHAAGVPAVGLSGSDGAIWRATRKKAVYTVENGKTRLITNSYTGKITSVNTRLLRILISGGFVPVLCPPAITAEGELVNVDNDAALPLLARALGIRTIVSLFEAPGFLRDPSDPASVIPRITEAEFPALMDSARGRMRKKLLGAQAAIEAGVSSQYWGDGRIEDPVHAALSGTGTTIISSRNTQ